MLAPAVALTASPVWAALPTTVTAPTEGVGGTTCAEGDILCSYGAYLKIGVTILATAVIAVFAIVFVINAFTKFRDYTGGRETLGHVVEWGVMGGVLVGISVFLAYLATQWMA